MSQSQTTHQKYWTPSRLRRRSAGRSLIVKGSKFQSLRQKQGNAIQQSLISFYLSIRKAFLKKLQPFATRFPLPRERNAGKNERKVRRSISGRRVVMDIQMGRARKRRGRKNGRNLLRRDTLQHILITHISTSNRHGHNRIQCNACPSVHEGVSDGILTVELNL